MKKAKYIGAGIDLEPILKYNEILEWIYIDSQPLSEFRIDRIKGFERDSFIPNLKKKF